MQREARFLDEAKIEPLIPWRSNTPNVGIMYILLGSQAIAPILVCHACESCLAGVPGRTSAALHKLLSIETPGGGCRSPVIVSQRTERKVILFFFLLLPKSQMPDFLIYATIGLENLVMTLGQDMRSKGTSMTRSHYRAHVCLHSRDYTKGGVPVS